MHSSIPGTWGILSIFLFLFTDFCPGAAKTHDDAEDFCVEGEARSRSRHALLQVKSDLPDNVADGKTKLKASGAVDVPENMPAAIKKIKKSKKSKKVDIPENVSNKEIDGADSKDPDNSDSRSAGSKELNASGAVDALGSVLDAKGGEADMPESDRLTQFETFGEVEAPKRKASGRTKHKDSEPKDSKPKGSKLGELYSKASELKESRASGHSTSETSERQSARQSESDDSEAGEVPENLSDLYDRFEVKSSKVSDMPKIQSGRPGESEDFKDSDVEETRADGHSNLSESEASEAVEASESLPEGYKSQSSKGMPDRLNKLIDAASVEVVESLADDDSTSQVPKARLIPESRSDRLSESIYATRAEVPQSRSGHHSKAPLGDYLLKSRGDEAIDVPESMPRGHSKSNISKGDEPITLQNGLEGDGAFNSERQLKMDVSESADILHERRGRASSKESGRASSKGSGRKSSKKSEASSVSVVDGCPQYRCGHIEFVNNGTRRCLGKSTSADAGIGAETVLQDRRSFDCVIFMLPPSGKGPLVDYTTSPPLCLTIAHGQFSDGNAIKYRPCSGESKSDGTFTAAPDQTWIVPTDDLGPVRATILPDKCMNVVEGNPSLGNRVQLFGCGNGDDVAVTFRFPSLS